jgi:hypothetical protein
MTDLTDHPDLTPAEIVRLRAAGFGAAMIGEDLHALSTSEEAKALSAGMGPAMLGTAPAPPKARPAAPPPPPPGSHSITEVVTLVQENPAMVIGLFDRELARAEGPRKGALKALLAAEEAKGDLANATLVKALSDTLDALG